MSDGLMKKNNQMGKV